MVPHPAGQIGLESMNFRSETTGSNHFSALSATPMVSGSVHALFGSIFQGRFFQDRYFQGRFFDVDVFEVKVSVSVQGHPAPRPKT